MSGINLRRYIEKELKIRDKDAQLVPLILNGPQKKLYDALAAQNRAGKPMRAIVLKARQMGFSTLAEAMIFKRTATRKNVRSGIVAHKEESAANLFRMSKLFYEELPDPLKPRLKTSNARELVFDGTKGEGLKSTIRVMTAGGQGIGRSDTFQNLHLSEFAFWPGDKKMTLAGLLQAVPDRRDTMVIIESTANGFDEFKAMWDRAVAKGAAVYRRSCGGKRMTANELFALAAGWLVQTPEESDDVKPFVPGMLNVLLAEALPYENALRRQEGLEELKEAPKVTAASMEEEIDYRPVLLRIALPYGLAADFCRAAENNAMMDDFRAKYVTALWESQQAKSETIKDFY